jgi:ABC-type sugar transport system ATPase subunit
LSPQATPQAPSSPNGEGGRLAVSLSQVSKLYGHQLALDSVSLEFGRGRITALLGHNGAGKSTIVKVLSGVVAPDRGSLAVAGGPEIEGGFDSPASARQAGIVAVQQDLNLIRELSVLENWALADHFSQKRAETVSWRRELRQAEAGLASIGLDRRLGPLLRRRVSELTSSQRAWVNLAIALLAKTSNGRPHMIILDEITSAIDAGEARELVAVARDFGGQDVALLLVTHDIEEALAVSERVVVMRDGRIAGDLVTTAADPAAIVATIVGEEGGAITGISRESADASASATGADPLLRLEHLERERPDVPVLTVLPGQVLGVTGLPDSGAFELPLQLATGELKGATRRGAGRIGYIPGDRALGVIPQASVRDNATLTSLAKVRTRVAGRSFPYLPASLARAATRSATDGLKVRMSSVDAPISSLSGGNQQKVLLARWLLADVDVLVLEEPLQGLDIGAKGAFLERIRRFADEGGAVLYVAGDAEELATCCERVAIMRGGQVGAVVECDGSPEIAKEITRGCYS